MNDELQKALAAMLSKTTSAVEAGVGFLQAELPDVIQQLLMWNMVKSAVFFSLWLGLSVLLVWFARRAWRNGEVEVVAFAGGGATFAVIFLLGNLDWLQILVAPKVYLIEYAASLAK